MCRAVLTRYSATLQCQFGRTSWSPLVEADSAVISKRRMAVWNEAIDLAAGPQPTIPNHLGVVVVQGCVQ